MLEMFAGIDPGQTGGISIVDQGGSLIRWYAMPLSGKEVDAYRVGFMLSEFSSLIIGIEIQGVRPEQGSVSGFRIGDNYGIIKGVTAGLGFTRYMIRPQEWQSAMLRGKPKGADTKVSALRTAKEIWPEESWLRTTKCVKPHDGAIDAALIAEYCRRKYWGEVLS